MTATIGGPAEVLADDAVAAFVDAQFAALDLDGRSLCLVIPDATRNCPLPLLLGAIVRAVEGRVRSLQAVVALGTHAAMTEAAMRAMVGVDGLNVVNHEWWDDDTFVPLGTLSAEDVGRLSGGRLEEAVPIRVNRLVVDSDVTVIVGPVLPHEVIGFSGGDKYLFPGLSGPELIDVTHWLGALITSSEIIGTRGITPVRALVHAAADLVPGERHALCVVVDHDTGGLHHAAFGDPRSAWAAAADVAAETHVEYLDAPVPAGRLPGRPPLRRPLDRGQGLLQGRADRGRRRRGDPLRPAHHPDRLDPPRARHHGLPLPGLVPGPLGRGQAPAPGRAGPLDPPLRRRHLRPRRGRAPAGPGHPGDRASPRRSCGGRTSGYLDPASVDLDALQADPDTLVVPDAGEVLYRLR